VVLVLGILFIVIGIPLLVLGCIFVVPMLGIFAFLGMAHNAPQQAAQGPKAAENAPIVKAEKQDWKKFIADNLGPNTYPGALSPTGSVWAKIDPKAKRTFKKSNEAGNIFGDWPYSETHPDGGVLIGFFAAEDDLELVCFVQPIFLTAKGEKAGI